MKKIISILTIALLVSCGCPEDDKNRRKRTKVTKEVKCITNCFENGDIVYHKLLNATKFVVINGNYGKEKVKVQYIDADGRLETAAEYKTSLTYTKPNK